MFFENQLFIPLLVTREDKFLTHISNDSTINKDLDLIFVEESGEQIWRREVDFASVSPGIGALSETVDGQILMAGLSDHPYFRGAHISKYDSSTGDLICCLLYTSPSPRDATLSRMPSSA